MTCINKGECKMYSEEFATVVSSGVISETPVKYGQIWYIKTQESKGSIQGGTRPVIIVSNDENNTYCPTVNVIPITTREKNELPVHTFIYSSPLKSTALTEQIATINKSELLSCIGELSRKEVRKLKICIMIQLNLI